MSLNQPLMALTAIATSDLRIKVQKKLGMVNPLLLLKSPDKTNITLVNAGIKNDYERAFQPILAELITKRTKLPRIIIYCKKNSDCGSLYTYFRISMGRKFTEPPGASDKIVECKLVDMFLLTCFTQELKQEAEVLWIREVQKNRLRSEWKYQFGLFMDRATGI